MTTLDPTPLIQPAEHVTVDTAHLHVVVQTLRAAYHYDGTPFRYQIVASVDFLRGLLTPSLILGRTLVTVDAEPLWWAVHAADELGNDRAISPIGHLFRAVDDLQYALEQQAPRTRRGMAAALEAECVIEVAAHTEDQP